MSKWAGKYAIGLTGNIGTGKSIVRRMLEHLGAYGIDADALSRRAISKGSPGYQPVIDAFGRWVLNAEGEIDRGKLAAVVFNHADALTTLEKIVHPLVQQAVDYYVRTSRHEVVVIEAIKLIEANIHKNCDSLWVTTVSHEIQLQRLLKDRKMDEADARRRITTQGDPQMKISEANVVINNDGTFTETWQQVSAAWEKIPPRKSMHTTLLVERHAHTRGEIKVLRGKPRHSAEIAEFINRLTHPKVLLTADDIMAAFGEKAYFLLQLDHNLSGIIGWQVENLVTRVMELYFDPIVKLEDVFPVLINEIEQASADLQSEAALVSVPEQYNISPAVFEKSGYKVSQPENLSVSAWHEAAQELYQPGRVLYFKQLRRDRILKPI